MHMTQTTWARFLLDARHRWWAAAALFALAVIAGLTGGWLMTVVSAVIVAALVLALVGGLWALRDIEIGYAAMIGVIALLPFGVLPVPFSPKPTFLDLALLLLFGVWAIQLVTRQQQDFIGGPLGVWVLAFFLFAIGAFVFGLSHASLDQKTARRFAEILLSILMYFLIVNTVRDEARLQRLTRLLILGGAAAALIAIVLYALPDQTTTKILLSLQRVGYYPEGGPVLRYIRDDPTLPQRATGTMIDQNVLGAFLIMTIALAVPQFFSKQRLLPRCLVTAVLGLMGLALLLTISRGAFVATVAAVLALGVLRYPRLLLILAIVLAVILLIPWTQSYVTHFFEGLRGEDLATQMRFGEYKDALILIQRYPLLGVGFSGSPDIDTYIGVSNMYLLIAEEMGLVGLAAFVAIMAALYIAAARVYKRFTGSSPLEPIWWGLHA
ncbi:MAG: O-antigen polymerase family protein, partial [Chloroflexi bacterium]|nr:O-antigen polymerase family protein [Chloroflexota bacterium]